jgi:glycosyltransferase involved in cell wall biosynthesis
MPSRPPPDGATLTFVVPWFGADVRGGAELQAWDTVRQIARNGYDVELWTTCSRSFLAAWGENAHPPGTTLVEGVSVRRFPVVPRDEALFGSLNGLLLSGGRLSAAQEDSFFANSINSAALRRAIADEGEGRLFVFIPYLYGTTIAGALVRPERSVLMPCFHDEPYGHLDRTKRVFAEVRGMLYLAPEEREALEGVVGGAVPGRVVGGGIDLPTAGDPARFRRETGIEDDFVLCVGRIDPGKNTHQLAAYFDFWARRAGRREKLVLIGGGEMPLPAGGGVVSLGPRPEQVKNDACAAAALLCQPSVNESFSRVIMEAWLQESPVLVNGHCAVTRGHCRRSGGGLWFDDYHQFAAAMDLLLGDRDLRSRLGRAGRAYVLDNYRWEKVVGRSVAAIEEMTGFRVRRLAS